MYSDNANIFSEIKEQLDIKDVIEHYGIKVKHNMFCCPFHGDKHPSASIKGDYFNCFVCGSAGDEIKYTAKLFNLRNIDAAKKLIADFNLNIETHSDESTRKAYKAFEKRKQLKSSETEWREAVDYIDRVFRNYHYLLKQAMDKIPFDSDLFAYAAQTMPTVEYYLSILDDDLTAENILELKRRAKEYEQKFYRFIYAIGRG